jgi:hypothetical protein
MSKRTFALSGKSANDERESSFSRSNPATNAVELGRDRSPPGRPPRDGGIRRELLRLGPPPIRLDSERGSYSIWVNYSRRFLAR